jgi:HEAT repeat protein
MPLFGPPNILQLKEKRDIKGLNNALKNKDPNIVREASFALADLGVYAAIGLLIGLSNSDWHVRRTAYTSFAIFKHFGYIPLLASLHDPHEMVRLDGLLGFMVHEDKRAIQPIGDCLLHDSSAHVRNGAVAALYKLGGEQALEYFLTARNDPDPDVKKAVDEVLTKLGY